MDERMTAFTERIRATPQIRVRANPTQLMGKKKRLGASPLRIAQCCYINAT